MRTRGLKLALLSPHLLTIALALSSCAAGRRPASPDQPSILYSPVGPALKAVWDAGGGISKWRKFGAIRFTYEAELGPASLSGMENALENWRSRRRIGPLKVRFSPGDWRSLDFDRGERQETLFLGHSPLPDVEDYALRNLRVFCGFPFNLADPVWEFQRSLIEEEPQDLSGFLLIPRGNISPHLAYRMLLDPGNGLPRIVYYEMNHPLFPLSQKIAFQRKAFQRKAFKAVFSGYRIQQGVQLATEITHYLCKPSPEQASIYPWEIPARFQEEMGGEPVPAGLRVGEGFVFRETFRDIVFEERSQPDEEARR